MLRTILRGIRSSSASFKESSALELEFKGLDTKADVSMAMLLTQQRRAMSANADKPQQTKSLFVMNVEGKRTTAPLLIGLMDYFQRWLPNVGYFEVRRCHSLGTDKHATTFRHHWPGRGCVLSAPCTHPDGIGLCEHMYGMQPIAGDAFPSDTGGGASRYVQLLSTAFSIQVQF